MNRVQEDSRRGQGALSQSASHAPRDEGAIGNGFVVVNSSGWEPFISIGGRRYSHLDDPQNRKSLSGLPNVAFA